MGDPIRILDLAETLITLSGLRPYEDIRIVEIGIRPGEKLYEELRFESEETVATSHPKIFINKISTLSGESIEFALRRLTELTREKQEEELRKFLSELLPEAHLNGKPLKPNADYPIKSLAAVGR
jgi:FlaA1/EpsC-like NDP-sugar epimerase